MSDGTLKAIILDFDGVILESNHIKARAFRELFNDYPEYGDQLEKLHMEHGGLPRFEKLQIIYRDFLRKPLTREEANRLSARFRDLVDEQIMSCPFVPGAKEFLKSYSPHFQLYVASGTPQDELRDQINRRGLSRYFHQTYGSPRHKSEILATILEENRWRPKQTVFIGDAIDDQVAASQLFIPFIGRVADNRPNPFVGQYESKTVGDLTELDRCWETLVQST